ncbi:hypothetical protein [Streptomyces bluensis]|uniref:Uncharacterized protein n=1 Tax=Streptomyces bluensis TaxID=33897 RepID=A0ABW6UBQ4_9ACTN
MSGEGRLRRGSGAAPIRRRRPPWRPRSAVRVLSQTESVSEARHTTTVSGMVNNQQAQLRREYRWSSPAPR